MSSVSAMAIIPQGSRIRSALLERDAPVRWLWKADGFAAPDSPMRRPQWRPHPVHASSRSPQAVVCSRPPYQTQAPCQCRTSCRAVSVASVASVASKYGRIVGVGGVPGVGTGVEAKSRRRSTQAAFHIGEARHAPGQA
eukprot:2439511-Prymnesium_polylepis.2